MESLKANGAAAGVVFEGFLELVRRAVWVLAGCGPVVEVGVDDEFTIEEDADLTVLAGDGEVIPFADGFGHALGWRHGIINGGDHAVFAAVSAVVDLDFERGFYILQHCMGRLADLGDWGSALAAFEKKHGVLAAGVAATLDEGVRRDAIKGMRSSISEPEHRFFLALLMNVSTRADLLTLVAQRFPEVPPVETVLRWAQELEEESPFGLVILDACFPETLEIAIEEQSALFLAALRHFMVGGKKSPDELRALSAKQVKELRGIFTVSSLRVLVG